MILVTPEARAIYMIDGTQFWICDRVWLIVPCSTAEDASHDEICTHAAKFKADRGMYVIAFTDLDVANRFLEENAGNHRPRCFPIGDDLLVMLRRMLVLGFKYISLNPDSCNSNAHNVERVIRVFENRMKIDREFIEPWREQVGNGSESFPDLIS